MEDGSIDIREYPYTHLSLPGEPLPEEALAAKKGEAAKDLEGLQTMRVLARNMSFLMKSIALGKEKFGLPETEEHAWTHFIRDSVSTYSDR